MREEALIENSARLGAKLMEQLKGLQARFPVMGEVRGLGLMIGVEFTTTDGQPDTDTAKAVIARCLDDSLILLSCGTYGNVVRWIPPLVIDDSQLDEALGIFSRAMEAAGA
jgi:4-aminobutyrate aminotransferase